MQDGSPSGGQPQGTGGSIVEELELLLLVPDEELLLNPPELLLLDGPGKLPLDELLLDGPGKLPADELLLEGRGRLLLVEEKELLLDGMGPPMLDDELGMAAALRKARCLGVASGPPMKGRSLREKRRSAPFDTDKCHSL